MLCTSALTASYSAGISPGIVLLSYLLDSPCYPKEHSLNVYVWHAGLKYSDLAGYMEMKIHLGKLGSIHSTVQSLSTGCIYLAGKFTSAN